MTISWPGEKPSLRFHSVGSTRLPNAFCGIASRLNATRRPVPPFAFDCGLFAGAASVNQSLGNG